MILKRSSFILRVLPESVEVGKCCEMCRVISNSYRMGWIEGSGEIAKYALSLGLLINIAAVRTSAGRMIGSRDSFPPKARGLQ